MKRVLVAASIVWCVSVSGVRADDWITPANGLTVTMIGASSISLGSPYPAGMDQGFAMVAFAETVSGAGWTSAACLNQRFYVPVTTAGGKAVYQVLLTAAALGKKVSGIIASPPNPGAANMCVVTYATIAF